MNVSQLFCCTHLSWRKNMPEQHARQHYRQELPHGHDGGKSQRPCPRDTSQRRLVLLFNDTHVARLSGSGRSAPNSLMVYTIANCPVVAAKDRAFIFQNAPASTKGVKQVLCARCDVNGQGSVRHSPSAAHLDGVSEKQPQPIDPQTAPAPPRTASCSTTSCRQSAKQRAELRESSAGSSLSRQAPAWPAAPPPHLVRCAHFTAVEEALLQRACQPVRPKIEQIQTHPPPARQRAAHVRLHWATAWLAIRSPREIGRLYSPRALPIQALRQRAPATKQVARATLRNSRLCELRPDGPLAGGVHLRGVPIRFTVCTKLVS